MGLKVTLYWPWCITQTRRQKGKKDSPKETYSSKRRFRDKLLHLGRTAGCDKENGKERRMYQENKESSKNQEEEKRKSKKNEEADQPKFSGGQPWGNH